MDSGGYYQKGDGGEEIKAKQAEGQAAKFNSQPRDRGAAKAHKAPRRAAAVSIKARSDGRNFKYDSASMEAAAVRYLGYGFLSKHQLLDG